MELLVPKHRAGSTGSNLNIINMYFLFGTTELKSKYKVKSSDNIE